MFRVLWNCKTVFHSKVHHFTFPLTTYEVSNFSVSCQHLLLSDSLIIAILVGLKWYHIVVSICVSVIANQVDYIFMYFWTFAYPFWRNFYSDPLPTFNLDYLDFYYSVVRVLYTRYKSLIRHIVYKDFLPFCVLLVFFCTFLIVFFGHKTF